MNTVFFRLIQIALGRGDVLGVALDDRQWEIIYAFAKKQALIGIINMAIERLPENEKPPRRVKVMFALAAEKIAQKNRMSDDGARKLTSILFGAGIMSCILKGQAVARLYPVPGVRQCGDIDVWVDKDRKEALASISTLWKTGDVFYHHVEVYPFDKNLEVEVHFTPSWMNDPIYNMRLQRYFRENASSQFAHFDESLGFATATPGFDCVFSLVHIYRHLLQEGIGLRQVMDYHFILYASTGREREEALAFVRTLGMSRFASALMYVIRIVTGCGNECLLCEPDERYGKFLLGEIMKSGNFGKYDARNRHSAGEGQFRRFCRRLARLPRYFCLAPREVLCAPGFRLWQYFWRMNF